MNKKLWIVLSLIYSILAITNLYANNIFSSFDYPKYYFSDNEKELLVQNNGFHFEINSLNEIKTIEFSKNNYRPLASIKYYEGMNEISYQQYLEGIGLKEYLIDFQMKTKKHTKNYTLFAIFEGVMGAVIVLDLSDYLFKEFDLITDQKSLFKSDQIRLGVGLSSAGLSIAGGILFYKKYREIGSIELLSIEDIIRYSYEINERIVSELMYQ